MNSLLLFLSGVSRVLFMNCTYTVERTYNTMLLVVLVEVLTIQYVQQHRWTTVSTRETGTYSTFCEESSSEGCTYSTFSQRVRARGYKRTPLARGERPEKKKGQQLQMPRRNSWVVRGTGRTYHVANTRSTIKMIEVDLIWSGYLSHSTVARLSAVVNRVMYRHTVEL